MMLLMFLIRNFNWGGMCRSVKAVVVAEIGGPILLMHEKTFSPMLD